jgi:hypothetical protein
MRYLLIIFICVPLSCTLNKKFKTIKYSVDNVGHNFILKIPKGYRFSHIGWESISDVYRYSDSSFIEVTDDENGGVNYDNIKAAGLESKLLKARLGKDTITFSGVDKKGLFWKYNLSGFYGINYKYVKPEKKAIFDKVIDSSEIK